MLQIREALIADVDQLAALFDLYRIFYRQIPDLQGAKNFVSDRISMSDSVFYIAVEEGNMIVGFTQLYPLFSSVSMKREWLLNDLYVETNSRNKGIAALLIERSKTLARCTGAKGILLETEKSNDVGNHLYPSIGFELINDNFYFWENERM